MKNAFPRIDAGRAEAAAFRLLFRAACACHGGLFFFQHIAELFEVLHVIRKETVLSCGLQYGNVAVETCRDQTAETGYYFPIFSEKAKGSPMN